MLPHFIEGGFRNDLEIPKREYKGESKIEQNIFLGKTKYIDLNQIDGKKKNRLTAVLYILLVMVCDLMWLLYNGI